MAGNTTVREYWRYFRQFVPYYLFAFVTLAHFVYTEVTWVPNMDKSFIIDTESISKSYVERELVTSELCLALTVLVPMCVCLAYCSSKTTDWKRSSVSRNFERAAWMQPSPHRFHCAMVLMWACIGVTAMLTNVLKFSIGNLRPDFVERCIPIQTATTRTPVRVSDTCSQPDLALLIEGMKSTPSGHSSMITCSCFFAWVWIHDHVTHISLSRKSILWLPLLALGVMVSRVVDHRHHWYDVVFGCVLGLLTVAAIYYGVPQKNPSSSSSQSDPDSLPT